MDAGRIGYRVVTQDGHELGVGKEVRGDRFHVAAPLERDYWLTVACVRSVGDRYVALGIDVEHLAACQVMPPS